MTVKQLEDVVVVDREVKLDQSQSRKTAEAAAVAAAAVAAAVAALVPNPKSRSTLQSKQPQFALLLSRDKLNLVRAQTLSLKFLWVTWCFAIPLQLRPFTEEVTQCTAVMCPSPKSEQSGLFMKNRSC